MASNAHELTPTHQPRQRGWKPWAVVGLVMVLTGVAIALQPGPPEVQRARSLRLGQTWNEVLAIMGEPGNAPNNPHANYAQMLFGTPGASSLVIEKLRSALGVPIRLGEFWDMHPVRVQFRSGRVVRIKRGREIIEAPNQ